MTSSVSVNLPPMLSARMDIKDVYPEERRFPAIWQYFIVLTFGGVEVSRWEWQADKPLAERTEPDEYDISDFIAAKLREKFFPDGE